MPSVDPIITEIVVVACSSQLAWDSLHLVNPKKSQSRIFSLCNQFVSLSKESLLVSTYLHHVFFLYNELATAGAIITDDELIVKILSGLGSAP